MEDIESVTRLSKEDEGARGQDAAWSAYRERENNCRKQWRSQTRSEQDLRDCGARYGQCRDAEGRTDPHSTNHTSRNHRPISRVGEEDKSGGHANEELRKPHNRV